MLASGFDALRRAKQHNKTADWIVRSASISIEWFGTREAARRAEAEPVLAA